METLWVGLYSLFTAPQNLSRVLVVYFWDALGKNSRPASSSGPSLWGHQLDGNLRGYLWYTADIFGRFETPLRFWPELLKCGKSWTRRSGFGSSVLRINVLRRPQERICLHRVPIWRLPAVWPPLLFCEKRAPLRGRSNTSYLGKSAGGEDRHPTGYSPCIFGLTHTVTHTGKRADGTHGAKSSKGHTSLEQKGPESTGKQYFRGF